MAKEVSERIKLNNPGNIDFWYGPYASLATANIVVPKSVRQGKTVCIMATEYWWRYGVEDSDLTLKNSGATDISALVFNEIPSGLINATNTEYTTASSFIPESVVVKSNGMTLKPIDEYVTIGDNKIQLTFSPQIGELILVDYIKV